MIKKKKKKSEECSFGILWISCITESKNKGNNEASKISWTELSRAGGYFEPLFLPLTQLFQHPTLLLPSTFLNFLDFLLAALPESILGVRAGSAPRQASTSHFPSRGFAFSAELWAHRTSESPHGGETLPLKKGKSALEGEMRAQNEHYIYISLIYIVYIYMYCICIYIHIDIYSFLAGNNAKNYQGKTSKLSWVQMSGWELWIFFSFLYF